MESDKAEKVWLVEMPESWLSQDGVTEGDRRWPPGILAFETEGMAAVVVDHLRLSNATPVSRSLDEAFALAEEYELALWLRGENRNSFYACGALDTTYYERIDHLRSSQ